LYELVADVAEVAAPARRAAAGGSGSGHSDRCR